MLKPVLFTVKGRDLPLSGPALTELMREILGKGVPFRFQARGFSMSPFIRDGDVVTVSALLKASPGLGEVVAFLHPAGGQLMVHRVIGRRDRARLFQGDNPDLSGDGWIPAENILGRVVRVERRGRRVRLGLGIERYGIALLSRLGLLHPGLRMAAGLRNKLGRWGVED